MNHRLLRSGVSSLLVASVCTLTLVISPAQSRRGASSYSAPRTAWGDPDIQGFWSYNDDVDTPFERPGELGGKAEFGDEELAAVLEERAKRNVERAPTIGGETGAGPTHWYEFWNAKSARTSKIVDPPDGRVPALTAEARERESRTSRGAEGTRARRLLGGSQPRRSLHRLARRLAARASSTPAATATSSGSSRVPATWSSRTR